jgi:biopolymer transport protein ExbB/TolQ
MRVNQQNEFFFQIIALLISIILVHTIFVTLIHPNAEATMLAALERVAQGEPFEVPRTLFIVLKDFEQEACFILMIWAIAIMAYKAMQVRHSASLLNYSLVEISEGSRILPEDAKQYTRTLDSLADNQKNSLLPRALRTALSRFSVTGEVQASTQAVNDICDNESEQLDAELSMVRYITWAIPSIGFIGTVRGIGAALGQAHEAVAGDIAGVTASLGVAFNSTMVALLISIVVMFLLQQLQIQQERLVIQARRYCEDRLLTYLKARAQV